MIRDSSESLAGRIIYLELNPLDIIELNNIIRIDKLWLKGGFPRSVLESSSELSDIWMQNFIKTYIERDLPILGLGAPIKTIEKLWTMLAHINGNLINYSQIASSIGVSVNTVKSYISFFEKSFLIRIVQPYFTNIKKRLVKSPKLYFRDTGILHHLLRLFDLDDLYGHPAVGNSWEAFVIQQISNNLDFKYDINFYRTQDRSELDFIIKKGNSLLAGIEIKFTNSPKLTKGNTIALNDLRIENNFILTPSSDDYPLRENIRVCSLEKFIFNYLPKIKK